MKELTKEQKTECLDYIIKLFNTGDSGNHICPKMHEYLSINIFQFERRYDVETRRVYVEGIEEEDSKEVFPELHSLIMEKGQQLLQHGLLYEYGDPWNYFVRTRDCRAFKIKVLTEFRKSLNL